MDVHRDRSQCYLLVDVLGLANDSLVLDFAVSSADFAVSSADSGADFAVSGAGFAASADADFAISEDDWDADKAGSQPRQW